MSGRSKWPGVPAMAFLVVLIVILYTFALATGRLSWPPWK